MICVLSAEVVDFALIVLYICTMANELNKRFFDLSSEEITESLQSVVLIEAEERKAKNLPLIYKNFMCINSNQFIHEYPDRRKFLISININNSEETILKEF